MSITFRCNLAGETTPLEHFWEHTVGSGHAPLALRADWQNQLLKTHKELGFKRVRFHSIMSDIMGTLLCVKNELLYSFFNSDRIFDFLISNGMKPFVELSFMPRTLSSGDKTVFHYAANVTPPADYGKWATLIKKIVAHWVERYGIENVREWFFEVWNEPNQPQFWAGSQEDYFKLYKYTAGAVKEVDESLQIGGPVTSKNEWISDFIEYCEKNDLPFDFVSTHQYPTDAFGEPGDKTKEKLAEARRDVMREQQQNVVRQAKGKPVFYTEWNSSSNPRDPLHDEPYAAAFVAKTVLQANGLVECYSFWTFTDIFEENYFPSEPFQGGFGLLNIYGIAKPTYRAFELLHNLGTELFRVDGIHATIDAWAVKKEKSVTLFLTNHTFPEHEILNEKITFTLENAPGKCSAFIERIDANHANAGRLWKEMDEPRYLKTEQIEELEEASKLIREPVICKNKENEIVFEFEMPPHSVVALTAEFSENF